MFALGCSCSLLLARVCSCLLLFAEMASRLSWDTSGNAWVHVVLIPTGPHEWVREVASEASSVCLVAVLVFLGKLTDVGVKLTVEHGSFCT